MADSTEMATKAGSYLLLRRLNWNAGMKFFLCVLGMVMIVEGLPYFAAPGKMKYWVQKVVATPDSSLRRLGLVLMVIGLFMVFVGRT